MLAGWASSGARCRPCSVLIMQADPIHGTAGFVAPLGCEVKPIERPHQQLSAAVIGRVAVENIALLVLNEDADAEHVRTVADGGQAVIVERAAGGAILLRERHAE